MKHKMKLDNNPFVKIKNCSKTIELRLNDEKRKKINIGDLIEFTNRDTKETILVKVTDIFRYKNFEELYKHFDKIAMGYEEDEICDYHDMEKYYSKEKQSTYGVLAIEIKAIWYRNLLVTLINEIYMSKIYIIGPVGSGKTTFSKKLSKISNIKRYELDKIVWDDEHGNIKRPDQEILKLFDKILQNNSWIIEDIGRSKFKKGREQAEIVPYIKLTRTKSYLRVIKRWIKQKLGIELYNSNSNFKQYIFYQL